MNNQKSLILSSLGHFLIDFTCAYVVLSRLHETYSAGQILILYNFLAFAMQMPFGVIADAYPHFKWSILGTLCVLLSLFPFPIVITVLLIGTGNALYHLGEGKVILDHMKGTSALGIFVAPGAFGITLGTLVSGKLQLTGWISLLLVILCILLHYRKYTGLNDAPYKQPSILSIIALFVVVIIRSFAGFSWILPWKSDALISMTCAVVFGKVLGGLFSDRFGSKRTAVVSLSLSMLCFTGSDHILTGLLSVLFFNMTMPICLKQITLHLKNSSGFAFGLLTFALFLGYLPSVFGISTVSKVTTLLLSGLSLALMAVIRSDVHD